jgi:ADP-ribosylglycohydrolase
MMTVQADRPEEQSKMITENSSAQKSHVPLCLLGAVSGDVIGSVYEFSRQKAYDFSLFSQDSKVTDDSILTLAIADAILHDRNYLAFIRRYAQAYPDRGYGGFFRKWMYSTDPQPYNSFGNGSAMRVSAVGWAFDNVEQVLLEAERSAAITHNHPEGIKGAQTTALCVLLSRKSASKAAIRQEVLSRFGYNLDRTVNQIRLTYEFTEACQETVPEAIVAFLESESYEDAIRKAISLGGDADTLAAITGAIAEAYYGGVPTVIIAEVKKRVPADLWTVIEKFSERYALPQNDIRGMP